MGNRLTQTTLAATTVYTYDDANRLINVGGVVYEWDNNIETGCKSKTPASDDRGFLFQTGGVNYALAAGERCPFGARARDGLEFVVYRQ